MIEEINILLEKMKFAITIKEDVADVMVYGEIDLFDFKELLDDNLDNLYVVAHEKKLYMKIKREVYELYFLEKLGYDNYFNFLEKFSVQKRCTVSDIEEYTHKGLMNHYHGVSFQLKVIEDAPSDKIDIFSSMEDLNILDDREVVLYGIKIVEERRDYIYFKYKGVAYEAKEIVGKFDVVADGEFIFSAFDKNDIYRKIKNMKKNNDKNLS